MDVSTEELPSAIGCALTVSSLFWIPRAWPVALMQGTVISNPRELFDAAEKYKGLAEKAKTAMNELNNLVSQDKHPDWHSDDREAFIKAHVTPYATALSQTAEMHEGISSSMHLTGVIYTGIGYLSMLTGGFMLACAVAVMGTPPPFDVATDIAANAAAEGAGSTFRGSFTRLSTLTLQVGRTLKFAKNALPALKYAVPGELLVAGAEYAGKSDLKGNKSKGDEISWPAPGNAGQNPGQNPTK
jgi:hypothetical protein